jgi:branched-chain amino acid transport system permease protein
VLGGIGNLPGNLLAGLFLGLTEAFTAFFAGTAWAPAVGVLLLLAVLIVLPQGVRLRQGIRRWRLG